MGALIFNQTDERNEIGHLIPSPVDRAVIRQRNNIIVEVIVHLNKLFYRQITVTCICLTVRLKFIAAPFVPINRVIRVCDYVFLAFCRRSDYENLNHKHNTQCHGNYLFCHLVYLPNYTYYFLYYVTFYAICQLSFYISIKM